MKRMMFKRAVSLINLIFSLSVYIFFYRHRSEAPFYICFASAVFYIISVVVYLFLYPKEASYYYRAPKLKPMPLNSPLNTVGRSIIRVNTYYDIVKIADKNKTQLFMYRFPAGKTEFYTHCGGMIYIFEYKLKEKAYENV